MAYHIETYMRRKKPVLVFFTGTNFTEVLEVHPMLTVTQHKEGAYKGSLMLLHPTLKVMGEAAIIRGGQWIVRFHDEQIVTLSHEDAYEMFKLDAHLTPDANRFFDRPHHKVVVKLPNKVLDEPTEEEKNNTQAYYARTRAAVYHHIRNALDDAGLADVLTGEEPHYGLSEHFTEQFKLTLEVYSEPASTEMVTPLVYDSYTEGKKEVASVLKDASKTTTD